MRLIVNFLLLFSSTFGAFGQSNFGPTFIFSSGKVNTGDEICVQVKTKDFTNLLEVYLPIKWDKDVLEFVRIQDFSNKLQGLDLNSFDLSKTDSGLLVMQWKLQDCSVATNSVTIDRSIEDSEVLFEICFKMVGGFGSFSIVEADDFENDCKNCPFVKRFFGAGESNNCNLILVDEEPGLVANGVDPVKINLQDESTFSGDRFCVSVTAEGFDSIVGAQFRIEWDSTQLKFEEIIDAEVLPGLDPFSSSNFFGPANFRNFTWQHPDLDKGVTLNNNQELFKVCFTATSPCLNYLTQTEVKISDEKDFVREIIPKNTNITLGLLIKNSQITFLRCPSSGLKLNSDCPINPGNLKDTICIPIETGDNFQNITRLGYRHTWNPRIMEFQKIENVDPSLRNFSFDDANSSGGILGIKAEPNADLPDNTKLYDVCFEITGLGGNSFFNFSNSNVDILKGNIPIVLNTETCIVEVNQPEKLLIFADDAEGFQDSTVCIDYTIKNFNDLTEINFELIWEPNYLSDLDIKFFIQDIKFDISQDRLKINWQSTSGLTLTDGDKLFSLCYKLIGSPEDCSPIILSPEAPFVKSNSSGSSDIGLIIDEPSICILNPPGFQIKLDQFETSPLDTLCVPFEIEDFQSIQMASFDIKWDPDVLKYSFIRNSGLLIGDSILSNSADVGILKYKWESVNSVSLNDTSLFEICFTTARESIGLCTKLSIENPEVLTDFGPGFIESSEGEICVEDRFVIKSLITFPVSCPGKNDGSAELEFEGGTINTQVAWFDINSGLPIDVGASPKRLKDGNVLLVIWDGLTPSLVDTINIELSSDLPFANAGNDTTYICGKTNELIGTGSTGTEFSYRWSAISGGFEGSPNNIKVKISGGGEYVFSVTQNSTNCTISDTVNVTSPDFPKVEIEGGKEKYLTCLDTIITINAITESTFFLLWSGANLIPSTPNLRTRQANRDGNITLQVIDFSNSCSTFDTIRIIDQTNPPIAIAGDDVELNCGFSLILKADSSQSLYENPLSFEWSSLVKDTQSLGADFIVSQLGTYLLHVTDEVTGCSASDTILVSSNPDDPRIEFNFSEFELNCKNPEFILSGSVINSNNFTSQWSSTNPDGFANPAGTSLNRTIIGPGIYNLEVNINDSPCVLSQSIEVTENFDPPIASISASGDTITCYNPSIILSVTNYTPDSFHTIEWFKDGQLFAEDSLELTVLQAGNYELVITDTHNGCQLKEGIVIQENKEVLPSPFSLVLIPTGMGVLDCERTSLDLDILPLPITPSDFSIMWETDTGNITSIPDFFSARVNKPGTYKAILTNLINGCSIDKETLITSDAVLPDAVASVDGKITCDSPERELNSVGSSLGSNFSYTWKNQSTNSNLSNEVVTDVSEPGFYILSILNEENSCSASDTIEVEIDTTAPQVIIQDSEILTCEKDTLILNATGTDFNPDYTYAWTGLDNQTVITANNPLLVQVVAGGEYQLSVKNNLNGCTGLAQIIVEVDQDFPQANPGSQKILECKGVPVTLDGSGSSIGENFTYSWTAISGGSAISNPSIASPQVTLPGIYKLVVTNTQTGCSSEGTVSVILNPDLILAVASGPTNIICELEATIEGNLPPGTSGIWRKITQDPILANPELASTSVSVLVPGNNLFEWSLSVPECPNYSMDTVNVEVAKAPIASDDALQLTNGLTQTTINILANDLIFGQDFSVSLLKSPDVGRVSEIETGSPQYLVRGGYFGEDFFTYLLCNELCENLCDTATVFIDIPFDEDYKAPPLPNAITPNGDGLNDFLEFELLEDSGTIYPDNELIIFNRWGDIVFRARPYNNDWSGRGNDGKELPHGTYYYVLRLNISEGIILKGDVTILQRN